MSKVLLACLVLILFFSLALRARLVPFTASPSPNCLQERRIRTGREGMLFVLDIIPRGINQILLLQTSNNNQGIPCAWRLLVNLLLSL